MEVLRWEGLCSSGQWQSSGAVMMMEPVQVHDPNCGLDDEEDQQHMSTVAEKKKGEENRMCLCHVPVDVWVHIFLQLSSFKDMAWASAVCRKWKEGMREALAFREKLSFAGWRADDFTVGRLVEGATNLLEVDMCRICGEFYPDPGSLGRWGSRITDAGLQRIANAKCCPNLTSISLWGVTGITDEGVVELVTKAHSLEHLNVGGTFITDISVLAMASHNRRLKVLNLWGCRHVTEAGILALARSCPMLSCINVWGMSISPACELRLTTLHPLLQLKPSQVKNHQVPTRT